MKPRCAYCGAGGPLTKDHIVPKRTGAHLYLPCGARNWRPACRPCNNYREHVGDCPAVVMLARRVATEHAVKTRHVLAAWGYIGGKMKREYARQKLGMVAP